MSTGTKHRPKHLTNETYTMFDETGNFSNAWPRNFNFLLGYSDNVLRQPIDDIKNAFGVSLKKNGVRVIISN